VRIVEDEPVLRKGLLRVVGASYVYLDYKFKTAMLGHKLTAGYSTSINDTGVGDR
jgi:hypothetical protein